MKQSTKRAWLAGLTSAAIAFGVMACVLLPAPERSALTATAETASSTRMHIESEEMVYNSNVGRTVHSDTFTRGKNAYVADRGLLLTPAQDYSAVATVLHCPETATGTYSISLSGSHVYRTEENAEAKMRFRLVKNDEIVYPTDGSWAKCDVVGAEGDLYVSASLTMEAGDDLYFIAYDEAATGNNSIMYVTAGMTINGVWFDATSANHINSANDETTTDGYFGGTYTYQQLFTYEYITNWYDYEPVDNTGFGDYQKRTVSASTSFNQKGSNQLWPAYDVDMRGAEYFAFTVDNSAGSKAYEFTADFYEGHAFNAPGSCWVPANNNEYFLLDANGIMQRFDMAADTNNRGKVSVPVGFSGQVLIPLTSLEHVSWQNPRSHGERFAKYGDPNEINLQQMYVMFFYLVNDPAEGETVTVTDVEFWGSDLKTTYVADTYQTAKQAIANIGTVTAASANQILKAQSLYNALSAEDQAKVTNYATLEAAVEAYKNLKNYNGYVGTSGKDFTGTDGVALNGLPTASPSSVSAWIKVDKDIADETHVGTIVGNMERTGTNSVLDASDIVSVEITKGGRPKLTWRISTTAKVTFVVQNVDVRTGSWINLAFVRDTVNNQLHCYINGVKVASKNVDAADIADITFANKPLLIGSDYTNDPTVAPGWTPDFNGSIANVKLYSGILSDAQIEENLTNSVADMGLMNDVTFRSGDDGDYYDSAANAEISDVGAWIENGAEQLKLGEYSFAILGDTQMMLSVAKDANGNSLYADGYDYTSNVFYKNVRWLIENKEKLNLQFVMHVGDLTDNGNNKTTYEATDGTTPYKYEKEFAYGVEWLDMLRSEGGIPYALARGNHETVANFENYYTAAANSQYVTADVTTTAEDGTATVVSGIYDESHMRDVAYTLQVGNQKYLIVVLDYEPTDAEIAWANAVVAAHPTHRTIILTHKYMTGSAVRYTSADIGSNYGETIWNKLVSQHENIIMLVSGHSSSANVGRRVDTGVNGNKVLQLMVDESCLEFSGMYQTGIFALLGFENDGNTIHFNFYSPSKDKLYRSYNQFTVELDGSFFNDADRATEEEKTQVIMQADMPIDAKPAFGAYGYYDTTNGFHTQSSVDSTSNASFSYSGFTVRVNRLQAVNLHMSADGIFRFIPESYLYGRNTSTLRLEVFVSGKDGTTRKAFPATDGYHTINKANYFYFEDIGGIEVKAGDTITIAFTTLDNAIYCYGRFDGYIEQADETKVIYALKAGYLPNSPKDWTDCNALYDGTKTDYSIGYISHIGSNVYEYTVTIKDLSGNVAHTISAGKNGVLALPELSRTGHVFAGYLIDGVLVPAKHQITVTTATELTAVFVEFGMINGAAVRLSDPAGIRFSTQINQAQYEALTAAGASVQFGTLIAMASDITANEAIDYSLLTVGCGVKHLNVVSTVQHDVGNYVQFNGAVVGIQAHNLAKQFAARAYMTITYADGTTATVYAHVTNNARSVAEVAAKALADKSALETNEYKYATDDGWSLYDETETGVLNGFIVA